jgi:hypothetical protein
LFRNAETKYFLINWEKQKWAPEKWVVCSSRKHYAWKDTVLAIKDPAPLPTRTAIDSEWKEYEPNIDCWMENPDISVTALDFETTVMIGSTPFPDNEPTKQLVKVRQKIALLVEEQDAMMAKLR